MKPKVLIVDDDTSILMLIYDVLTENGLDVEMAQSGEKALQLIQNQQFDLILLDIMMKGISGLEVCRQIRDRVSCPILFLSAKDSISDIVRGLDLGADDYITKPFVVDEVVARIHAHLRREERADSSRPSSMPIQIGEIRLDPMRMTVSKNGTPVELSTREFELLSYLMHNAGQILSREQIFHDVWKTEYGDIGTVAINIKNLRSKLDPDWEYIKTIWGSGYLFVSQSAFNEEKAEKSENAGHDK